MAPTHASMLSEILSGTATDGTLGLKEISVGAFNARLDLDTVGRCATFHRRLDVKDRQFEKKLYNALQSLFGQAERSDDQVCVLTRQ